MQETKQIIKNKIIKDANVHNVNPIWVLFILMGHHQLSLDSALTLHY
jgi:hypothetical protein